MNVRTSSRILELIIRLVVFGFGGVSLAAERDSNFFPSFADRHTVGL